MVSEYFFYPSPLVGEGGAKRRMRGLYPHDASILADTDPSSGSPSLRAVDPPSPTRGEGKKVPQIIFRHPCRNSLPSFV
jgi:hypothetical protein